MENQDSASCEPSGFQCKAVSWTTAQETRAYTEMRTIRGRELECVRLRIREKGEMEHSGNLHKSPLESRMELHETGEKSMQ